ncbi:uncharacterized protein BDCG_00875 [Blastomyces dermatitidis ER-3]|uniref:Mid2 domain-containing protein n=1 Tax=Ajellomyces dermatitidis (strain ER-3 / ATCC MYA-2586) TaxID=559297 RepID=A0ABP2EQF5_AJEDR|nr:uncharacterized protein BDCG_00875 [Blastomyces dermatitidis ER-3]EEQ84070.1 hypothetical protein BDCG_00875 [Blastomyces dermatitidis ER-3]
MRWTPSLSLLLLSVLLLAITVVGAEQPNHHGRKRQIISIDDPAASATESPSEEPTTTTTTTSTTSTREDPTTTSETAKEEPTTKPSDSPTSKTTTNRPTRPTDRTTPRPTRTPTPPPTRSSVIIVTNTITLSGSTYEQTSASTIAPGQTLAPGLGNDAGGRRTSSGLSESSERIIIGVVVGVGGAVILGGLAFVAWRLRRKRNARGLGDDDDLMNAGTAVGSSSLETSTTAAGASPFKSTLDQYHHPGGVNPSSNF